MNKLIGELREKLRSLEKQKRDIEYEEDMIKQNLRDAECKEYRIMKRVLLNHVPDIPAICKKLGVEFEGYYGDTEYDFDVKITVYVAIAEMYKFKVYIDEPTLKLVITSNRDNAGVRPKEIDILEMALANKLKSWLEEER